VLIITPRFSGIGRLPATNEECATQFAFKLW